MTDTASLHADSAARGWIQTYTGAQFFPLAPDPAAICLNDIAHALALKCRFMGHSLDFYSVGQHSVLVSGAAQERFPDRPDLWLWGLMHDAAEAYLPDVARPIKPHLHGFDAIEARVMAAVAERFALAPRTMPAEVKALDGAILTDERAAVLAQTRMPAAEWGNPYPALGIAIEPWPWETAKQRFIARFMELRGEKV